MHLVVIAWLGTQTAQRLLIVVAAISALLMLVPVSPGAGMVRMRATLSSKARS